ncbi:MAG TPA: histidinol-phosphate transaminase [Actinomycetota bacterium]|nr:histidinol-phosphate transaminase [Actinomycetota bacterium]
MKPLLGVRDDLVGHPPYVSPQWPVTYRMNTNESPYPPPGALVQEITAQLGAVAFNRYPEGDARALFDALSTAVGWPSDGLWVANGSNEIFLHLLLAYGGKGRKSMTFEPTYALHSSIARISGTEVVQVERGEGFEIDLDAAVAAISKHKPHIVIACSPNNPTGNLDPLGSIRALLEEVDGLVVVDEAYGEFADSGDSAASLLADHRNLIIVKTFSKAWRLAGVRIGYLMADQEVVDGLRRVRLPYHLSAVTQLVGSAALEHRSETDVLARAVADERDRIAVELQAFGLKTYPSHANFVLFEVDDSEAVWKSLLHRGILIRNYPSVPRLMHCLRVTAGTSAETDVFLAAMKEILGDDV